MSDALEQELRAALAEKASAMPAAADAKRRLQQAVYRPQVRRALLPVLGALPSEPGPRQRVLLWPTVSAAIAVLTAGVVAAVLLLSSGIPEAFAGWTAVPTTATKLEIAEALQACRQVGARSVLSASARGPYVQVLYTGAGGRLDVEECIARGGRAIGLSGTIVTSAKPRPGRDQITRPAYGAAFLGSKHRIHGMKQVLRVMLRNTEMLRDEIPLTSGSLVSASGVAGRDVTGVVMVLKGGERVQATVEHGWYSAWWPGSASHRVYAVPTAVEVITTSGTHTMKITRPQRRGRPATGG